MEFLHFGNLGGGLDLIAFDPSPKTNYHTLRRARGSVRLSWACVKSWLPLPLPNGTSVANGFPICRCWAKNIEDQPVFECFVGVHSSSLKVDATRRDEASDAFQRSGLVFDEGSHVCASLADLARCKCGSS